MVGLRRIPITDNGAHRSLRGGIHFFPKSKELSFLSVYSIHLILSKDESCS
jgi:hypothetical protein